MMYKKSSSKWSRLRSLELVPAVVVAAAVFSIPAVASMINEVSETDFSWIGYKVSEKASDDNAIRIVGYKAGEKTPDAPVIYINGKKSTKEEMDVLPPSKIKSIKVDKENNKIDILLSEADEVSEKAPDDHAIRIVGYKADEKTPDVPVIYINGNKSTKEEMDALSPSKIKSIKVDKENNKIDILLSEADED